MKGRRTWYRYDEDYKLLQAESPTGRILDITMDDAYRITDITLTAIPSVTNTMRKAI